MALANHSGGEAVKGEPLFREHGQQVAALCWRFSSRHGLALEILLITSRNSHRWILPKGWAEAELSPAENAAREAFEEAGVIGTVGPEPIGRYHYLKEKKEGGGIACRVDVFALAVSKQLDDWREKDERRLAWLPIAEAMARVSEPGLRQVMKHFQKQLMLAKASTPMRRRSYSFTRSKG
jgi:8-oxo-dGTP pyrophosphatase MutT (NUDIX family)